MDEAVEIAERIVDVLFVEQCLDEGDGVTIDTDLQDDLGMDSLEMLVLAMEVEKALNVPDEFNLSGRIFNAKTPRDMGKMLVGVVELQRA